MKIFDGRTQAQKIEEDIKGIIADNPQLLEKILAIVLIGSDPSSEKFIKIKSDLCEKLGIAYEVYKIDENLSDEEITTKVKDIFESREVGGGIVQLPLPRKSLYTILDFIPIEKDVDVISTAGKDRFYLGDFSVLSPVLRAFENFLKENKLDISGLKCVVVGDGELVGKPISFYLEKKGAEVELLSNYDGASKLDCDLLVLSAGVPNLVKGESIPQGCNVVDFGSSVVNGKCVGDLDMSSDLDHLGCVSKSPGGMGPLVVRYLLLNHFEFNL